MISYISDMSKTFHTKVTKSCSLECVADVSSEMFSCLGDNDASGVTFLRVSSETFGELPRASELRLKRFGFKINLRLVCFSRLKKRIQRENHVQIRFLFNSAIKTK